MPTTTASSSSPHTGHGRAILLILLGLFVLFWWVMASLVQIQTTEAFLLAEKSANFIPNWDVIQQPAQIAQGQIASSMGMAIMGGWAVELLFLIFVVGFEITVSAVRAANKKLAKIFVIGMILIILFDLFTDYLYGHIGSGVYGQILFAVIMGIVVTFFSLAGVAMIEHGIRNWGK